MVTAAAATVYVVTMAVGVAAWVGRVGFGRLHHVLYLVTAVAALLAVWREFHPGLLVTVAALAALPFTRPRRRTIWHPLLAVAGLVGYGAILVLPYPP